MVCSDSVPKGCQKMVMLLQRSKFFPSLCISQSIFLCTFLGLKLRSYNLLYPLSTVYALAQTYCLLFPLTFSDSMPLFMLLPLPEIPSEYYHRRPILQSLVKYHFLQKAFLFPTSDMSLFLKSCNNCTYTSLKVI